MFEIPEEENNFLYVILKTVNSIYTGEKYFLRGNQVVALHRELFVFKKVGSRVELVMLDMAKNTYQLSITEVALDLRPGTQFHVISINKYSKYLIAWNRGEKSHYQVFYLEFEQHEFLSAKVSEF